MATENSIDVMVIPVRLIIMVFTTRPIWSLLIFVPDINHFTFEQIDTPKSLNKANTYSWWFIT